MRVKSICFKANLNLSLVKDLKTISQFKNYTVVIYITYSLQTTKPLVWEMVKFTERFDFVNTSKVVHVVADDGITKEWQHFEW